MDDRSRAGSGAAAAREGGVSGFLGRQHKPESKARISASLQGKPHPHRGRKGWYSRKVIDALADRNRIIWDCDMDRVLADGLRRGWSMLLIAEEIGVSEATARKRADALGLDRPRRKSAA